MKNKFIPFKKTFQKVLDNNMTFVYMFFCEKTEYKGTYEDFLNEYRDFLKQPKYTSLTKECD